MNVSVVIPTFNRVGLLTRALDSVIAQSLPAAEIIVVDDGSTDTTADVLAQSYPQVAVYTQDNKGVSAARNVGIQHAQSEWIALLDSDDEWLPHKLRRQREALELSGLLVSHTQEIWIRNGVRVNQMKKHHKTGGSIFEQCLPMCAMSPSSIIIHRSVFDTVGVFDESLPACEDYDLWLRIAAQFDVDYLQEACINKYGGHADQLSRQYWGMDRFRVIALEKILLLDRKSPMLDDSQRSAATRMLLKKLKILAQGAHKHNNNELYESCVETIARWTHD